MLASRAIRIVFFVAGTAVLSLFPGCLVPFLPLLSRVAGNAVTDLLLDLTR